MYLATSRPFSIEPARVFEPSAPAKTPNPPTETITLAGCGFGRVRVQVALKYPKVTRDNS